MMSIFSLLTRGRFPCKRRIQDIPWLLNRKSVGTGQPYRNRTETTNATIQHQLNNSVFSGQWTFLQQEVWNIAQ